MNDLSLCNTLVQAQKSMAIFNNKLTESEKAAIYYHIFGGCNDWLLLYAIADGKKPENVRNRSTIYKWKNSHKIQDLLSKVQKEKDSALQAFADEQRKTETDSGGNVATETSTQRTKPKYKDYSRPDNQTEKLNELVNTATDAGDALDALKVIISAQRADKESAKDGKQVRAYVPISCTECPLYEKASKKVTK